MPKKAATATPIADDVNPFGPPPTPAPPPVNAQELVSRLTQLQRDVAAADRERAVAETTLAQAQKEKEETDAHLRAMGVDPDKAEEALAALEQNLATLTAQFEASVARERTVYQQIAAAAQ